MSEQQQLPLGSDELFTPEAPPLDLTAAPAAGSRNLPNDPLRRLVDSNFLQYASYVIRDRAIPHLDDGLKPVQRRILHSLHANDDGKFIKVANIVGYCMQFHPHGDASIGDALVNLANKRYLIEGQGNFGNLHTGDPAAAVRYIECRLTPLAREELFADELTDFVPTYDGRKQEPVTLPSRLPLLLMLGAEGIAVGISTRILPHNFGELIEAQIAILQKKPFDVLPDFVQGGRMDAAGYAEGRGSIRLRARVEIRDAHSLVIREIPFGTTTDSIIASIEEVGRKGKLKLRSINDFTSENVEIEVRLQEDQDAARAVEALFAFTQCEVQLASRIVVIRENRPVELDVPGVLRHNSERLLQLLQQELKLSQKNLTEELHRKTLAQLFIENRVYQRIEACRSPEEAEQAVRDGMAPFRDRLQRDLTQADVTLLLDIPVRRISLFDLGRNVQEMEKIRGQLAEARENLANLVAHAVRYLRRIQKKHAGDYPRRTEVTRFDAIAIRDLTSSELSIAYDRAKGYLGHKIPGAPMLACSSLDKLLLVWNDGRIKIVAPPDKLFVDASLAYCGILNKERVLTVVYTLDFFTYAKKFMAGGMITNREYRFASKGAEVRFFADDAPAQLHARYGEADAKAIAQQTFELDALPVRDRDGRGATLTMKSVVFVGATKPPDWDEARTGPRGSFIDGIAARRG
jgi:topoisomerase-4 subunit A